MRNSQEPRPHAAGGEQGKAGEYEHNHAGTPAIDFGALFNSSPNAYMVLDRRLRFVAANDAYLSSVGGVGREEIIGRPLFDAFPGDPDEPDNIGVRQVRASLERVLANGKVDHLAVIPYTIPVHTPGGVRNTERYWSATHTPILDDRGDVAYVLQHTVDVTELQQMKQALRAAEAALDADGRLPHEQIEEGVFRRAQIVQEANQTLEAERRRFQILFEQAPGFIAVLAGPQHVFSLVNAAYYQMVGHRDIVGKAVAQALPEVTEQGFIELLDEVYTTGEPFVGRGVQLYLERTPGAPLDEVYVDFLYQPIVEPDGSISGIFVQGHEVTDQLRAQEELRQLNSTLEQRVQQRTVELELRNRELQEFAYVASHDLQEPLRKIHSFADLLVAEHAASLDEQARSYLGRLQHAALRMSNLISDLLAFSRVQTRGDTFARVDLGQVAQEVLVDLEEAVREAKAGVDVGPLPEVEADATQMRQLLQNVIGNALKYRRADVPLRVQVGGRVEAGAEASPSVAVIEVADNGIGFEEKYLDRIFTPFQRLHGRGVYGGTGMGLAICRRIVERHGGAITARSSPGAGSVFEIRLPVRRPAG